MKSASNPKEVVRSFLDALNKQDLKAARGRMNDALRFTAPDGAPIEGADAYLAGWKPLGLSYAIRKTFVDGEDVCALYDLTFSKPAVTLFACGWYHVNRGKIDSIKVIFDPRPLLERRK
jgi:limonene-1,2-epoxide hydrolase